MRFRRFHNGWKDVAKVAISAIGGLGLLQMVLELDTRRCASKDAGLQGEWIVRSDYENQGRCWIGVGEMPESLLRVLLRLTLRPRFEVEA
ncbi:hypothetical protein SDJN02_01287, partial [Cucurbita argyrosperma subsp. argyrosperma]